MLTVNNLTGFGGGGAEAPGVTITDSDNDITSSSGGFTQTFDIGKPNKGHRRYIIAVITSDDDSTTYDDTYTQSATLGGNAMTEVNAVRYADQKAGAVWIGIIDATGLGSSAELIFSTTGSSPGWDSHMAVIFRAVGLSSPTAGTTPTGSSNLSITVPTNGFGVLGAEAGTGSGLGAMTGTNIIAIINNAGSIAYTTTAGATTADSSNAETFAGATWTFQ